MAIIDAHVHIWAGDVDPYPWDHSLGFKPSFLAPCEDLLAAMDAAAVDRAVLIQPSCYGFDNRYILDCAGRYPDRLVGMVLVDPLSEGAADRLEYWVEECGAQGLRLNAAREPASTWLQDPATYPLWERAAHLRVPIGLLLEPHQLLAAEAMISHYPEVTVIIDHLARIKPAEPDYQKHVSRLLALAGYPNTYVKLSGFYALSSDDYPYPDMRRLAESVLRSFGAKRTMWASDLPLATRQVSYKRVLQVLDVILSGLTALERSWVFGKTASRLWSFE